MIKTALIICSYQPNKNASDLLRCALDTLTYFNNNQYDIWVFDVGSPKKKYRVNETEYPSVNFVNYKKTPVNISYLSGWRLYLKSILPPKYLRNGSYINGWTIDYAISYFNKLNYKPKYFMTLQMDIMVCKQDWICDLYNIFGPDTGAVGVRVQKNFNKKEEILHSLGCLWEFEKYKLTNQLFLPSFPDFDVGEKAISELKKLNYKINYLYNTYNKSVDWDILPTLSIDKSYNSSKQLVFVHLGRGIIKSKNKKLSIDDWKSLKNRIISDGIN